MYKRTLFLILICLLLAGVIVSGCSDDRGNSRTVSDNVTKVYYDYLAEGKHVRLRQPATISCQRRTLFR